MELIIALLLLLSPTGHTEDWGKYWSPSNGGPAVYNLKSNCEALEGVACIESTACDPTVCSPVAGVMTPDPTKQAAKAAADTEAAAKVTKRAALKAAMIVCARKADLLPAEIKACLFNIIKSVAAPDLNSGDL